jgi:hypothetical protein
LEFRIRLIFVGHFKLGAAVSSHNIARNIDFRTGNAFLRGI